MKHLLEVDSILLSFGNKQVLRNIYLSCETGQIVGLLGRNGSGKSSLLNIIYGELKTFEKSVRINGEVLYEAYKEPQYMRYLPQCSFVPKQLTLKRIFKDYDLSTQQFLHYFPSFEKYLNQSFESLSGGEQRIIEVYMVLCANTLFCLLDEPFSQVMPLHVEVLKEIMQREKQSKGILLTDHLHHDVSSISTKMYVLTQGKTHLVHQASDLVDLGYTLR